MARATCSAVQIQCSWAIDGELYTRNQLISFGLVFYSQQHSTHAHIYTNPCSVRLIVLLHMYCVTFVSYLVASFRISDIGDTHTLVQGEIDRGFHDPHN